MSKALVEYTDTFGGEANYCWVRRATIIDAPRGDGSKELRAMEMRVRRKAKKAVGISGLRGRWEEIGGDLAFYPYRTCTVMFITWEV